MKLSEASLTTRIGAAIVLPFFILACGVFVVALVPLLAVASPLLCLFVPEKVTIGEDIL